MPGCGVGEKAAEALGLRPGTPIGIGMIDAHAGGIGCLGAEVDRSSHAEGMDVKLEGRLGLIAGTSTCHMASSITPCFVPGVWGPYYSAMFPGLYLNEGGQSAAGAFLDFIIASHPAGSVVKAAAEAASEPPAAYLNRKLEQMANAKGGSVSELAADVHITPDVNGNRSPLADPSMRAGVVGISFAVSEEELAILYLASVQVWRW
eukprot:scaffold58148_cov32-Tisochrysis_lutea.AAC.2